MRQSGGDLEPNGIARAIGTLPALFVAMVLVLTSASLAFAVRGGDRAG